MTEIKRDIDNKVPAFQKVYTLTNTQYFVRLTYNKYDDSWYMSLYTPDLTPVILSIRLVTMIFLFQNKRAFPGIPAGDFKVVQKSSDMTKNISYDSFGDEFILYYYEPEEVVYI